MLNSWHMHELLYTYKNSPVSYYRIGSGKKILVAFHGFDQSGKYYGFFEPLLGKQYTIIAIDFFYHGKSEWREEADFTETDMRDIVLGIAKQEQLVARKFTVCSFSMGARMARALVRTFPDRIDKLVLISPPTFAFNRFLNFTTGTLFGLWVFNYFLTHHMQLAKWAERLHRMKILNRSVFLFTSKFITKPERLLKVYRTWYAQRRLRTNFTIFSHLLDKHHIHLVLIAGKHDALTPPHRMIKYVRKLNNRQVFLHTKKHELQSQEVLHILGKVLLEQN